MNKALIDDEKLNKEQLEAVKHKKGPLLIIAGAGTGKTTVITERIKYLISNDLAKPSEILALTFTEKAAQEMVERVDIAIPYGYTQMWISTFHSFCDRILRREALHIGLDPKYHLMTESESIQFVRNNLFKFDLNYFRPLGNPTKFVSGMLQHFSRLQDEDINPNEYFAWVNSKYKISDSKITTEEKIERDKFKELAKSYKTYDEMKVKESVLDFGDLIVKSLKLFRERKNILSNYINQFKFILVDEFQDTNFAQNELAMMLAGKAANITVCGDDDQSIYRFRGAAVSNIIQFRNNFPKAKIVVLTENYRSTQIILDRAYALIKHNDPDRLEAVEKIDKRLKSVSGSDGKNVKFIHTDRVENEADEVAKEISRLLNNKEIKLHYKDIAILVRANNHSEPFGRALARHGIPYQFLGPGRLFKQPEVVDLISYLKVLNNFEDSVAFYRFLSIDYLNVASRDLVAIGNYARRYSLSLFEACEKIDDIFVHKDTKEKIKKLIGLIENHLKLVRKETTGQILYYFLQDSGLIQKLINPQSPEAQKKAANISKFFDKLKTYEVDHEDSTIPAVVDWIELASELGESPLAADSDWNEVDAVNILTVHSSKGLEFPVVFLVNLVSNRFPTNERREQIPIPDEIIKEVLPSGDYHLQEERRLFYVGMTRAKELLFFSAADYYGEGKREKHLSPFIFEALGDKTISAELTTTKLEQLSFLEYKSSEEASKVTVKQPPIHIDYLSYSQIETFKTCPLHYKLKYIYKIPTPPSAAQSFGISIHSALKDFYVSIKAKQKGTKKLLLHLLSENWTRDGYKGKSHEEKALKAAKKYLTTYFEKEFDPKIIPYSVEQNFVLPLPLVNKERRLKIGGKIDRVDVLNNGKIEIIDYKTGANIPTQRQVDHDLQLTFYALAAINIKDKPFTDDPDDILLTLYYFDGQKKITTTRTKEELEEMVKKIYKIREEIEKSDFKCSGGFLCKNCEYKLMCNF
jgi:DNA helicase-2/ATP-dependent DNA helicase PcrA